MPSTLAPTTGRTGGARRHVGEIDLVRMVAISLVVAIHVLELIDPDGRASGAVDMVFHSSRDLFFFVSGLVLMLSSGLGPRLPNPLRLWRRRFPPVLWPYLSWTLIYWLADSVDWGNQWPPSPSLPGLAHDLLTGWNQLYFLLVTMQLYVVFPLLAWLVRRTRGRHWLVCLLSLLLQLVWTGVVTYRGTAGTGLLGAVVGGASDLVFSYQFYFIAGAVAADHLEQILQGLRRYAPAVVGLGVLGLLLAEAIYLLNLRVLGMVPLDASGEFQPAIVVVTLAVLCLTGVVGARLVDAAADRHWVARALERGADLSFGVFLSHVLVLFILVQPGVRQLFGLDRMGVPLRMLVTFLLTMTVPAALSFGLRLTPASRVLMGRPRLRRGAPRADPAGA